jgi:hypothetical protein
MVDNWLREFFKHHNALWKCRGVGKALPHMLRPRPKLVDLDNVVEGFVGNEVLAPPT